MDDAQLAADQRPTRSAAFAGFAVSLASIVACGFLSLPALALSLIGLRRGPRGWALAGVAISIATGIGWGLALLHVQRALDDLSRPTLAESVWTRAEEVVEEARRRRQDEPSGQAREARWQGQGREEAVITARWSPLGDAGVTQVESFASRPSRGGGGGGTIAATVAILADGTAVLTPEAFSSWALAPFDDPLPGSAAALAGRLLQSATELFIEAVDAGSKAILADASVRGTLPADGEGRAILDRLAMDGREASIGDRGNAMLSVGTRRYRRLGEDRFELSFALEIAGDKAPAPPSFAEVAILGGGERKGEIVLPRR